ncbi:hypothetical protein CFIO01_12454 [Colletotrichum fioriniae PJ7]|uniref:Uncharacterized protein n=1 Tax=Colletotrichum fioriniae PJ7 TaxID=1445577 RepID=A0A010R1Y9_9PEZI|nr:hypothetical protein CFIO01_12454 [Colletotrichum fioriniae PJ7]
MEGMDHGNHYGYQSTYHYHSRDSTLVQFDALQFDPPQIPTSSPLHLPIADHLRMNLDRMPTPYSLSSNQPLITSSWPCEPLLRAVHLYTSLGSRVPPHGTVPHETCLGGLSTVDREPTYRRRRSGPESGLAALDLVRAPQSLRAPSANRLLLLETTRHDVFTLFTPSDGVMVSDGFDGGLDPTARSRRTECSAGQKFGLKYLFLLLPVDLEQPALSRTAPPRSIVNLGRLVAVALGAYQTLARTGSMGSFTMK